RVRLGQGQGWCELLPAVGFTDEEPHRDEGQRHVVMPALPGPHLVFVHPCLTFASFEAGFDAHSRLDDTRQLRQRRLLQLCLMCLSRGEIVTIAVSGVLIAGIPGCLGFQRALVRMWTTGDHQPLMRPRPFPFQTGLHAALDHLDLYRPLLAVSYCQPRPPLWVEGLPPGRHRLPRRLRRPSAPLIGRAWGLQVTHCGGTGYPQYIAFATRSELVTKLRVATQFIITDHPAVRNLCAPQVEHLQALLRPRTIGHVFRHMAFATPLLVPSPVFRKGQAEVEQGMIAGRDVPHIHPHLTVVDLPPMATPLPLDAYRVRAPLRETAGIKGDHAIGFPQPLDDFCD